MKTSDTKKTLSPRAFLWRTLALTLALLLLMGATVVLVDPYSHFRVAETAYVVNGRFCQPGLARNGDYDSALVGSSMCQNFDMDHFRQTLGKNTLKLTKGGMTPAETTALFSLLAQNEGVDTVYCGIDLTRFNETGTGEEYYPDYLLDDSVLNDYLYLYGYETWMRFLPLDVGLILLSAMGIEAPAFLAEETDIDAVGRWFERSVAAGEFRGEAALVERYLAGQGSVGAQDVSGMRERMDAQLEAWLDGDPFKEGTTYHLFFSPYSALYWVHAERAGYREILLEFRTHFFDRLSEYDNVVLYDFQAMEQTQDLWLYKDITHYHASVNDAMAEALARGEYLATAERVAENNRQITRFSDALMEEYPALSTPLN